MVRTTLGTAVVLASVVVGWTGTALAADYRCGCPPHRHHRHVAVVRQPSGHVVYRRFATPRPVYNYEDNGAYDADIPPVQPVGQPASWLDGYGTRPVYVPGYGSTNAYGGSAQVWPVPVPPIPPAGGLAVYSPGAYGPGPRIIHIPGG